MSEKAAEDGARRHPAGEPGSWLQPGPDPTIMALVGSEPEYGRALYTSYSLCSSTFQTNKYFSFFEDLLRNRIIAS